MPTIELPPEWGSWLSLNIKRRIAPEILIKGMVSAGFDSQAATFIVMQLVNPAAAKHIPPPREVRIPPFPSKSGATGDYVNDVVPVAQGNRIDLGDRVVEVGTRIAKPCVISFSNFLSDEECAQVIERATPRLTPSTVINPATGKGEVTNHRQSEGGLFKRGEDEFIAMIEARISRLINQPVENGEGMAILHYNPGDQYHPHYDYFPIQNPGSHVRMQIGGQRICTFIMYLNDVAEGGATHFPEAGITIHPKKGSALYFQYCNEEGKVDPLTLHAGLPVLAGEKWIMTKWMRQRLFGPPVQG